MASRREYSIEAVRNGGKPAELKVRTPAKDRFALGSMATTESGPPPHRDISDSIKRSAAEPTTAQTTRTLYKPCDRDSETALIAEHCGTGTGSASNGE
jgi:hypothetical protein